MKKVITAIVVSLLLCAFSAHTVYSLTDGNIPVPETETVEENTFILDALTAAVETEEVPVYLNDNSFLKPRASGSAISASGNHWEYSDGSAYISIDKIWYGNSNVYVAHLTFSDYSRFHTVWDGGTAASVAANYGAILAVNCDVATGTGYVTIRDGSVTVGGRLSTVATYSRNDGYLRDGGAYNGSDAAYLAETGAVTDTFQFGPAFLIGGGITNIYSEGRAQRTFIGTSGAPGDIVIGVSSGRYADGVSEGLTYRECAEILQSYGCTFGAPLDGGGSSTMIFRGTVLVGGQRGGLGDFIYFR